MRKSKPKPIIICIICGTGFSDKHKRSNKNKLKMKFCSESCRIKESVTRMKVLVLRRNRTQLNKNRNEEIIKLRDSGAKLREISEKYKISMATVFQITGKKNKK